MCGYHWALAGMSAAVAVAALGMQGVVRVGEHRDGYLLVLGVAPTAAQVAAAVAAEYCIVPHPVQTVAGSLAYSESVRQTAFLRAMANDPRGRPWARIWMAVRSTRLYEPSMYGAYADAARSLGLAARECVYPPCSFCAEQTVGGCRSVRQVGSSVSAARFCGQPICWTCQQHIGGRCRQCMAVEAWPGPLLL